MQLQMADMLMTAVDNWDKLAKLAYQGYLQVGRGGVCLEFEDASDSPKSIGYIGEEKLLDPEFDLGEEGAKILAEYNPGNEVFVLFKQPGSLGYFEMETPDGKKTPRELRR